MRFCSKRTRRKVIAGFSLLLAMSGFSMNRADCEKPMRASYPAFDQTLRPMLGDFRAAIKKGYFNPERAKLLARLGVTLNSGATEEFSLPNLSLIRTRLQEMKQSGELGPNAIEPVSIVIPSANEEGDPTGWQDIPLGAKLPKGFKHLMSMNKFNIYETLVLLSQRKWVISHPHIDDYNIPMFVHDFIFHYTSMVIYPDYADALAEVSQALLQNERIKDDRGRSSLFQIAKVGQFYWALEQLQDLSPQWRGAALFNEIGWPRFKKAQEAKTVKDFEDVLRSLPIEKITALGKSLLNTLPFAVRNLGAVPAHDLEEYWFNEKLKSNWVSNDETLAGRLSQLESLLDSPGAPRSGLESVLGLMLAHLRALSVLSAEQLVRDSLPDYSPANGYYRLFVESGTGEDMASPAYFGFMKLVPPR